MRARILGTGSFLPEHIITNEDMTRVVETSDEWIRERTGIRQRHLTAEGTVDMAEKASKKALEDSGVDADELDLILVGTVSPDYLYPNTACQLQQRIGAGKIPCMDISAACCGFLFALNTAASYIQSGLYEKILVVGAETLSRFVDWNDRSTCVLFGDGAGAAVVGADEEGILAMEMGCDGSRGMVLSCEGYPIQNPVVHRESDGGKLRMNGQEVFKFAVRAIPQSIQRTLDQAGMTVDQVDHFVMHQANQRILMAAVKALKIPAEKIPMNMDRCGNLASASVPVLLDEYQRAGKIQKGDTVMITAFGGGLSWGSALLTW